jgi:hypothetical protein
MTSRTSFRATFIFISIGALPLALSSCTRNGDHSREGLVGTWKLAALEEAAPDGTLHPADCTGSLILTDDGRMSVQVMYRSSNAHTAAAPVQYAQGGYEASFGRYAIDDPGRSFTYDVEGALVRTLVGQHQKRLYELSGKRLVIKPPTPNEHWRVTWERE